MRFDFSRPGFVDACTAVMLVLEEPGRKVARTEIDREQYFFSAYMLFTYRNQHRLRIEDPDMSRFEPFRQAKLLAEKYDLDLSDALQIVSLKHGWFSRFVQESKPVLITVDGDLSTAALNEGLRVWNCQNEATPPPY